MNTNSLTDEVFAQLQGAPLRNLRQQLSIGPAQLAGAVDRDRDGDVDISDLIGLVGSVLGAATRPR